MFFKKKILAIIMLLMCFSPALAQEQTSENILKINTTLVNVPVVAIDLKKKKTGKKKLSEKEKAWKISKK
ncbi:MAG: hypothetical protein JNM06_18485 [Blastocatellia bacterium]|nr:hypothetical protein [Blastocatellia bacterium]